MTASNTFLKNRPSNFLRALQKASSVTGWTLGTPQRVPQVDQKRVMATCAKLKGEFGVDGYYVGVPCILGADGIEKIIEFKLNDEEQGMFNHSVDAVKELIGSMNL